MPIRPLAEMTWEEARDAQEKAWIALLPIGAVEAHGPHLPIRTDGLTTFQEAGGPKAYFGFPADASAEEGAATLRVLVAIVEEAVLVVLSPSDGDDTVEPSHGAAGNGGGAS